jgi:hypothetical protein
LVRWIDRHHRQIGELEYRATLSDAGDGDIPMLAVEVRGAAGLVATYKCGISHPVEPKGWLVLAPLVVSWNGARPDNSSGLGRAMVEHLVSALRTFQASASLQTEGVLIGSGNLTRAKAGRPFFEGLGWEIVVPALRSPYQLYTQERIAAALTVIERQIDCAIAPLLKAGKIEAEPVRFGVLVVP